MNESYNLREAEGDRCASDQWLSPLCEPRTCRRTIKSTPFVSLSELGRVSRRRVPHLSMEQLSTRSFMGGRSFL